MTKDEDKVVLLGNAINDGRRVTPRQALEDALKDLDDPDCDFAKGDKLLVISLDTTNDNYNVRWIQAGMNMSECIALTEIAKVTFLQQMEYVKGGSP